MRVEAKCPFCKDGCEHCVDGLIEVEFAEGLVYGLWCDTCNGWGFGFHIAEGPDEEAPDLDGACCSECGSNQVRWLLSGYHTEE